MAISCRLLDDQSFHQHMRSLISERKSLLFQDKSVAQAFQFAVDTVCRKQPEMGQKPSGVRPLPLSTINPGISTAESDYEIAA